MSRLGSLLTRLYQAPPQNLPAATNNHQDRLAEVVEVVTECCHLALAHPRPTSLVRALDRYPREQLGFAYEGAGVGLAALDTVLPWRSRTHEFAAKYAPKYRYAIYLGAGMGLARLHRRPERFISGLRDDVFGWVVWDGYGFHEGLFAYRRHVQERHVPAWINGFALSIFDQGLGRAVWFGTGAVVHDVAASIAAFPRQRRGDLWAGVGLAASYTGGVPLADLIELRELAGPHVGRLAEGAAVAAKNRRDPANVADHNESALSTFYGANSREISNLANAALLDLPDDGPEPAYGMWRTRLRTLTHTNGGTHEW